MVGVPGEEPILPRAGQGDHPTGLSLLAALLGALLLRTLPVREARSRDQLMSILRLLATNRRLAERMPRCNDTRKFKLSKKVLKSSDMIRSLFVAVREFLAEQTRLHLRS